MIPLLLMISLSSGGLVARDSHTGLAVPASPSMVAAAASTSASSITLWVDSEQPAYLRPQAVAARLRSGSMLLHGHVSDAQSGLPLSARVTLSSEVFATNETGYFSLYAAAPESRIPSGADLIVEAEGYQRTIVRNTPLISGADTHFIIRLQRGSGTTERDDSHKIWLHRPGGTHPEQEALPMLPLPEAMSMTAFAVPETIRVGFNCATANTCSTVEIMSLETYVKRGLNDEWIASWEMESLRAGAVAYRSYGAHHVGRPRTATYDICSTSTCQVNDADTSSRTDAAVDSTRGVVLVKDGQIFRSEYSAENNNLLGERSCSNLDRSCGDGFAGSPSTGWPCLHDPLCSGFSCFGHGRGMCQWGTQRWAQQGRDWRWIVNHYYNDEGRPNGLRSAFIAEPVEPVAPARRRAVRR